MANIKKRRNGVFEYRRVVPIRLRGHLPPVPGFADKATRTEFTQSLETSVVREANRKAADLDAVVDAAFAEAEQRLKSGTTAAAGGAQSETAHRLLDPDAAFAAFDKWLAASKHTARLAAFHADPTPDLSAAASARSERNYRLSQPNPWMLLPEFDPTMLAALSGHGIRVKPDHPAVPNLRPAFAAVWRDLVAAEKRYRAGQWDDGQETAAPPAANIIARPQPTGRTLEECLADYFADRGERADMRLYVRYLIDVVGPHMPIAAITVEHLRQYRDLLRRKPAHLKQTQEGMTLHQLAAAGDAMPPEAKRMTDTTIVNKWLEMLKALFNHAQLGQHITHNPVAALLAGQRFKRKKSSRLMFSDAALVTLYTSPMFTGCRSANPRDRHIPGPVIIQDAPYWVSLICLYTGARINEIGQCHITDFAIMQGASARQVPVLKITTETDDDDDDETGATLAQKALKNQGSQRIVPLHPVIMKHGFGEYVAGLRAKKARYLFPDLPHGGDVKPTKELSKKLNRYLDKIGIDDPRYSFHSTRHTFKHASRGVILRATHDSLSGHATTQETLDLITGDSDGTPSTDYGRGARIDVLYDAILKISYPIPSHQAMLTSSETLVAD